jgi:hypothetical protein
VNRVVFRVANSVDQYNQPFVSISLEEPLVFGSPDYPFPCNGNETEFAALKSAVLEADSVRAAGGRLFNAVAQNPDIAQYLQTALQTGNGARFPVYVEIATNAGAEALPWEVLCSPGGDFLGLDERWSLARMVQPPGSAAPFYTLEPPVRIAALLSCLGVPADGELAALRESVTSFGPARAQLLVIASEEQLVVDLRKQMEDGQAPEIAAVELVPGDLDQLQALVAGFAPHVLHLFCHGSIKGSPHVQLALKSDWKGAASSGLLLEAGDFRDFTSRTDDLPWLVVLNCCEGAVAGEGADAHSLALALALEGVAPAVVGMREPVISNTANAVTRGVYGKLMAGLAERMDAADQDVQPVDWALFTVAARDRLARIHEGVPRTQAAASTKEWTLPVLYVRPQEFQLSVLPASPPSPTPSPPPIPGAPEEPAGDAPEGEPPSPPPPPAPPADDTAERTARLEIEALQAVLATLPADQAGPLRDEATARIAELAGQLGVSLASGDG